MVKLCWVPLLALLLLLRHLPRLSSVQLAAMSSRESATDPIRLPRPIWLAGAAIIVAIYVLGAPYFVFWLATLAYLAALLRLGTPLEPQVGQTSMELPTRWSNVIVVLLIVSAVTITLVSHRPDIDDAFYLNMAVSAQDHADRPPYQFDGMHGEAGLPLLAPYYRVVSYELLVALIASLSGLPTAAVYYLLMPAIMAALVMLAYWLALRELSGPSAVIGLAASLIVLIAWGDGHRTYGNFGFVRMFQGKSALISLCVPTLVYYGARFFRLRDASSWIGLALTQVAAIGFSSSGLVVAPVASALVLLGAWRPNRADTKTFAVGLTASIYVIGAALILLLGTENSPNLGAEAARHFTTEEALDLVLGTNGRAFFALFALLVVPTLATTPARHGLLSGTAFATALLLLNPLSADMAARAVSVMSWRIQWSVPFPLWVGLAGAGFAAYITTLRSRVWGGVGCALWCAMFVALPGSWTVSERNKTYLGTPGYKVAPEYEVAGTVTAATPSRGSVIAPWSVAAWIPTHPAAPSVAAVRPHYLPIIESVSGKEEARARRDMVSFISGSTGVMNRRTEIMDSIQARGFSTVVLPLSHSYREQVAEKLSAVGYVRSASGKYEIWVGPR
jgi:hypothetical protein